MKEERMFPRNYTIKSKMFGKIGKAKSALRELENHQSIPVEKKLKETGSSETQEKVLLK